MFELYFEESPVVWDLLSRAVALLHLFHYTTWWRQIVPLVGKEGIYPVARQMALRGRGATPRSLWKTIQSRPNLLWWIGNSDRVLEWICLSGALGSILLMVSPAWFWPFWFYFILANITISHAGGPFILQTEPYFVEISFLMALCGPLIYWISVPSPTAFLLGSPQAHSSGWEYGTTLGLWGMRYLTFRMMVSAGLVKWYGSPTWRQGTAMDLHYVTQPLPNVISYWVHFLPHWAHKMSVWSTFALELVLPWGVFLPWGPVGYLVVAGVIGLMGMINITGNYGYLGLTTSVVACSCLWDAIIPQWVITLDQQLIQMIPSSGMVWTSFLDLMGWTEFVQLEIQSSVWYFVGSLIVVLVVVGAISIGWALEILLGTDCVLSTIRRKPAWMCLPKFVDSFELQMSQFCLVNRYGMFAAMNTYRWEIMIEGSNDKKTWERYEFKYKINYPDDRPTFVPYSYWPRLDWMIWFLPLQFHRQRENTRLPSWFYRFLYALLTNNPSVCGLLKRNPFEKEPPKYVRALLYDYKFRGQKNELLDSVTDNPKEDIPESNFLTLDPSYHKCTHGKWWTEVGPIGVLVSPISK